MTSFSVVSSQHPSVTQRTGDDTILPPMLASSGASSTMLRGPGVVGQEGAIRNLEEGVLVEGGEYVPDQATDAGLVSAVRRGKCKTT
jgi:hypothetical protein